MELTPAVAVFDQWPRVRNCFSFNHLPDRIILKHVINDFLKVSVAPVSLGGALPINAIFTGFLPFPVSFPLALWVLPGIACQENDKFLCQEEPKLQHLSNSLPPLTLWGTVATLRSNISALI